MLKAIEKDTVAISRVSPNRRGGPLTFYEFVDAMKYLGLDVKTIYDPNGTGVVQFHVTGQITGFQVNMLAQAPLLPRPCYDELLTQFYVDLGRLVGSTISGTS